MTPPAPKHQPKTNPPARKILYAASAAAGGLPTPEPALRCPRCDSPNTKFCYYNNYSLAQPRHFCKTCRRYWTRGGALRNVPIGGGCRKTKKHKPSGDSGAPPGLDFSHAVDLPKLPSLAISSSPACFSAPGFQQMGSFMNSQNSLTIESLSSINQDLHWKLQRQRLATLFPGAGDDDGQKNQKNYEPAGSCGNHITNIGLSTDLFFNNPYADVAPSNLNEGTSNWSSGIQDLY